MLGDVRMDIKPNTMTIAQLLASRCQFFIPRFQREYSWDKSILSIKYIAIIRMEKKKYFQITEVLSIFFQKVTVNQH